MTPWLAFVHLLNFSAPAWGLGLCMGVAELLACRRGSAWRQLLQAWVLHTALGLAVLMLGLAVLERDGKVWTYAALLAGSGALSAWRTRR